MTTGRRHVDRRTGLLRLLWILLCLGLLAAYISVPADLRSSDIVYGRF